MSGNGTLGARLEGKRALITGASSGIGAATARLFAAHGAKLALLARQSEPLGSLTNEIGAPRAVAIICDVRDPRAVADAVARAWEHLEGIDVLVNCAGIAKPSSLKDLTPQLWRETLDCNLSGTFYPSREVGLRMAAGSAGTIVNMSSELAFLGMPTNVAYCTSKAGLTGLTRALAAELAPKVTVNAVCAGPVDTPLLRGAFMTYRDMYGVDLDGVRTATEDRVPLKRLARAEEVALAILYLAADASYATGTMLALDGGTTAIVR